ncbi:MAG: hypothetical protein CMP64_05430 [Flavobacteriales bacterium]|nr:hypothetical protein [Flavobacteriales bacterium]
MKILFSLLLLFSLIFFGVKPNTNADDPPFYNLDSTVWVDNLMSSMTLDQRIAQLFMVAAYSNKDISHQNEIENLIINYQIGGLMFMQGGPVRQLKLTNKYQSLSKVPLMIAQDAEWGLSMRIDSTIIYPWQMTLGALSCDSLIYNMGFDIAQQCKRIGVNINFAPVVDVNSNPNNPIINNRSFGENPFRVAQKSLAYMQGLQDGGVMACAKHFPGHGDTDSDSHKTLPIINHTYERLDTVDLIPFKTLIEKGLGSVMVAHLHIPSIDDTDSLASTLSPNIVRDLLKDSLAFKGLVITDALNMKGVSQFYEPGLVDLKALLAGNDILLFAEDVPKAIKKVKEAIVNKEISEDYINLRCRKVLMSKKWFDLDKLVTLDESNLMQDLKAKSYMTINRSLVEKSMTVLQNINDILPLKRLDTLNIAVVSIGEQSSQFQKSISNYAPVKTFHLNEEHSDEQRKKMLDSLVQYNLVIASVHKSNKHPWKSYRIYQSTDLFLQTLALQSKVVLSVFANPYSISDFLMTYSFDGLIMAYQNSDIAQFYAAQLIFGGIGADATLPVSNKHFDEGFGLITKPSRLKYDYPESLGMDSDLLFKIDSIALDAIEKEATPGCQILAIKDGVVFYNKSFGYHTYNKNKPVKNSDIYDLASITKIIATVPAIMHLEENGDLHLDSCLEDYINISDTSNKNNLSIREILAHQAGLKSWIPFYKQTIDKNGNLRDTLYSNRYSDTFNVNVADGIYLHNSYPDTILAQILASKISDKTYKYSDVGFYIFKDIIENKTKLSFNDFVNQKYYSPLGLNTMGFLPKSRFDHSRIVPSEFDYYFRSQLLQGDVHDMGAAMLGGVGGHAGLFSNANDLGIFMQMLLNGGEYGGERFFQKQTINKFTECQYCNNDNRRGAGFDKPILEGQEGGPSCDCSPSSEAFGHSGFTGTLVWADPEEKFVYVFLSNRIHPTSENKKLLEMDVRTKIMQVFYDAIRTLN